LVVILGWDIGGVNTKVASVADDGTVATRSRPFELQRDPGALVGVLRDMAVDVGMSPDADFSCALTMTAELSQMFRTKREGVGFVLDAVLAAFPAADIRVFATDGRFLASDKAREEPLLVAAANWAATAHFVAETYPTSLLIDVGTTTTDIIPIIDGAVAAFGTTDPDRLSTGELVYTGAVRTPVEAIVREVPYRGSTASVAAEGFAVIGDVHVWLKQLASQDYTVPSPDGRPASPEFAGERLARAICADREMLDEPEITQIASAIAEAQRISLTVAIARVCSRHPEIRTAVVAGVGDFIAADAARACGRDVVKLGDTVGADAGRYAPAAAVALLRKAELDTSRTARPREGSSASIARSPRRWNSSVDMVIKVGGGLLQHVAHLDRVLAAIVDVARVRRVVVVPGGGPFADTVRHVDERLGLGDDTAHWMAVMAMNQYASLLAARINGAVTATPAVIEMAHRRGQVPVLAPLSWLRTADPLPHTWDVTSDSIAAWVAGKLRAPRLLLVKPPGAQGRQLVDAYFEKALSPRVDHDCLDADAAIDLLNQIVGNASPALEPR
jgi:probable H4MPT-linked C1 transfer pathway protein